MVDLHTKVMAEATRKMSTLANSGFSRLIEWHGEQDKAVRLQWRLG